MAFPAGKIERRCRWCGRRYLGLISSKYCGNDCKNSAKSATKTQRANENLKATLTELEEYNRRNKTCLTYGQYIAMLEKRKK